MSFKLTLGMIVRNEGRTLEKCLESVAPWVDEIIIGLAGESTDNTLDIIKDWNKVLDNRPIKYFDIPWEDDFSAARNALWERVTGDYFMWLDGDDVLRGGEQIRGLIRSNPNVDQFFMGYDYGRDEHGNTVCYLIRERIVRLQDELPDRGWKWIGKVHEVLAPQGFVPRSMPTDLVVEHHKPLNKHEPGRNLRILYEQLSASEPNPDPRILAYLATENLGRGDLKEAILHAQRFVKLSGWQEERYQMQHRIADMYRTMGETEKALQADFLAISIQPDWPDAYLGLAETYTVLNNYRAVIEWTKAAASKQTPQTSLIINPLDYTYRPLLILAGAYAWMGDLEIALENYRKAFEIIQEPMVQEQIRMITRELELRNVVQSFLVLREHLGRHDEWLKVRNLFNSVPAYVRHHPAIMEAWDRTMTQTAHVTKPSIMADFYRDNPDWTPIDDKQLEGAEWTTHPRIKFASSVVERIHARTVVDWGCSDGFIALPLARDHGIHVTGFDLDPRCIDLAQRRSDRWGVDARFEVGDVNDIGGWEGDKADLAIAFEIIEHTVDPDDFLRRLELTAKHIALTTPYLAWEGGNLPNWDRVEPKGHLRIFDQFDLEALITPRGRIWNLYKEPWGQTGWLFVDYEVGATHDKNITIAAMGTPEPWNPKMFEEGGLGGSETAIIKISEAFAKRGHRPIVYTNTDSPGYYNGVCYRPTEHYRDRVASDLFIAWRAPELIDGDVNTKCSVLWMHDTDAGDRLTLERARKFDYIVVLSNWHKNYMMEKYPFLRPENCPGGHDPLVVIGNGIDLSRFSGPTVARNPKKVIYSSSPDRGLDIILEHIWPKVIERVPDAELHIYYGWDNFDKFIPMFPQLGVFKQKVMELLVNSKGVVQHGRVDQKTLADAFKQSSVWLYPTYFTETYCISAIEAQLAGAVPITNRLAALNETVQSGINIQGEVHDPEVQAAYVEAVVQVLTSPIEERAAVHEKITEKTPFLTWDEVARLWSDFFLEGESLWQTLSSTMGETTSSTAQSTGPQTPSELV